jgi:hypothetical protein
MLLVECAQTSVSSSKGKKTMLHNLAIGSLVFALFSGTCAIGVGRSLSRFTRPLTYAALGIAVVLYVVDVFSS